MRWPTWNLRKAGIVVLGMLLFVLIAFVPLSTAVAHEKMSVVATSTPATLQSTPTVDATMTALQKEQLTQEIQQLKDQNNPDLLGWLRTNAAIILSTLVVVIGGLIGLFRWFGDRRSEREKRAEERFLAVVTGLSDKKEGAKIGAAILLRTFLRPGYEPFYTQTFDLAVASLCPTETPHQNRDTPVTLTTLRQALIAVFKGAFPLARSQNKDGPQSLDARYIQLDNGYLSHADLEQVWMPNASLRKVVLVEANLKAANLYKADLRHANLKRAQLAQADLISADLRDADLTGASLTGAKLNNANFDRAHLSETNLQAAQSLEGTDLRGVKGLSPQQLLACKAKGAIIDDDTTTNAPQTVVTPSPTDINTQHTTTTSAQAGSVPAPQSNKVQASAVEPRRASTPLRTDDKSNTTVQPGTQP